MVILPTFPIEGILITVVLPLEPQVDVDLARPLEFELEAGGRGPDTEGLRQHPVHLPAAHPAGVPGQGLGQQSGALSLVLIPRDTLLSLVDPSSLP